MTRIKLAATATVSTLSLTLAGCMGGGNIPSASAPITQSEAQMGALAGLADERRGVAASIEAHERIIASPDYSWQPT